MPRVNPIQVAWNAGEFSPRMVGRVDFAKYDNAASFMENLLVFPQGGCTRRPGTRYIAATKSSGAAILIPFQFSTTQAYIIEAGNLYFRFYRNQGQIVSGTPVEIVTPYVTADLYQLKWVQSADTLYIVHPSYAPRKLVRASHTSWTLSVISWEDGPYFDLNATATTLALSGTTGSVTVTASAITGINDDAGFQTTDVGRLIRWRDAASNWTWLTITARADTTHVTATISGPDASAGTATANWRLGLWSDTTSYPAAIGFFEERLYTGGSTDAPQRFDGSVPADFENYQPSQAGGTVNDDDAVSYTIASDDQSRIRWFSPGTKLIIGTAGGEFVASSDGAILTPTDVMVTRHTKLGVADLAPVRVNQTVLFVQRAGREVAEFVFQFESDSFVSADLTQLSDHITKPSIIQMAYQAQPDSLVWCVRSDGQLAVMTYRREQDVVGWTRQVIGGTFSTGDAVVESVAVIPGNDGSGQVYSSADRDEVWLVVKRTVNSATVRYVEVVEGLFEGPRLEDYDEDKDDWETAMIAAQVDQFFVDSGLTYDGAATDTITGLDHLEGETVKVLGDGAVLSDAVVASGSITLASAVSKAHVGLAGPWKWKSLKIPRGAAAGSAVAKVKRIHKVALVLDSTGPFDYGPARGGRVTATFREVAYLMDTAVPLFTGEHQVLFDDGPETDPRIYLTGEEPCNFTMLAIAPEMRTWDVI